MSLKKCISKKATGGGKIQGRSLCGQAGCHRTGSTLPTRRGEYSPRSPRCAAAYIGSARECPSRPCTPTRCVWAFQEHWHCKRGIWGKRHKKKHSLFRRVWGARGLPGVGAFDPAMEKLHSSGLVQHLRRWHHGGHPLLGICLGLQLLFWDLDCAEWPGG